MTHMQMYVRVGFEISIVDCFNQLLCYLDDLLFTGFGKKETRSQLEGEKQLTERWFGVMTFSLITSGSLPLWLQLCAPL